MFKYCPKCAGELKLKKIDYAEHPVCQSCGFVFFQNSKPTVGAVIVNDQNEVLLVKRAIEPHLGKWAIPSGFLENGEDPVVGLKREVGEELGAAVEPINILGICVDDYAYTKGPFYTFNVFYRAKIISGEIKLDRENSQFRYFAKNEIPWDDLGFKSTEFAVKKFYNLK